MASTYLGPMEGTTFQHARLHERQMRVRIVPTKDGGLRLTRFNMRRNLKVRESVLDVDQRERFEAMGSEDKVRFLFRELWPYDL